MKIMKIAAAAWLTAAFILLFSSCAGDGSDNDYISGAERRSRKETEMLINVSSTIYTLPAMAQVKVKVDDLYADEKPMDIYYPPGFSFSEKLPAVVIYNGFACLNSKNMGSQIDWACLVAAHGMIAVTYEPHYPDKDLDLLLVNLIERADELNIMEQNLGIISSCGDCPAALRAFIGEDAVYAGNLQTGVFLYGTMPWNDEIRTDSSMLLVKTGKGLEADIKRSIDNFISAADLKGMDVRLLDYAEGFKYFDLTETPYQLWEVNANKQLAADCEIVKEILGWMQDRMLAAAR